MGAALGAQPARRAALTITEEKMHGPAPIAALAGAATLPAVVAAMMAAFGPWDLPVLALALFLALPLYAIGRDAARP